MNKLTLDDLLNLIMSYNPLEVDKIRKAYERTKEFFERIDSSSYGEVDFKDFIEEEDGEDGGDDLGDFTSRYTDE